MTLDGLSEITGGPKYREAAMNAIRYAFDRYKDAEDLFTRGIEYGNRELPGKDHPTTLAYMNGLAVLRTKQKQHEEVERSTKH